MFHSPKRFINIASCSQWKDISRFFEPRILFFLLACIEMECLKGITDVLFCSCSQTNKIFIYRIYTFQIILFFRKNRSEVTFSFFGTDSKKFGHGRTSFIENGLTMQLKPFMIVSISWVLWFVDDFGNC